jgi:tetratricopeptide (TPR) repeat protein
MEFTYQLAYSKQMFEEYESAKEIYRELAKDSSDLYASRALFHQGYIHHFVENNIDSAKFFYIRAIENEPRMYEAWHNLGMCHEAKGDRLNAIQSYATALKHNPEFTFSREAAERLR